MLTSSLILISMSLWLFAPVSLAQDIQRIPVAFGTTESEIFPVSPNVPEKIIGKPNDGCILGATAIPRTNPHYELINTFRNHQFGSQTLIQFLDRLGRSAKQKNWGKLTIGDASCACGGKMSKGHNSHRTGLDADVFFKFQNQPLSYEARNAWGEAEQLKHEIVKFDDMMPAGQEVERTSAFRPEYLELVAEAARDPSLDRIFVSPAIKAAMCKMYPDFKANPWLLKVRPESGHKAHFHVRLQCPASSRETCLSPPPIPVDKPVPTDSPELTAAKSVGCAGEIFAKWFKPQPPTLAKIPPLSPSAMKCLLEYNQLQLYKIDNDTRCLVVTTEAEIKKNQPVRLGCRNFKTESTWTLECPAPWSATSLRGCSNPFSQTTTTPNTSIRN